MHAFLSREKSLTAIEVLAIVGTLGVCCYLCLPVYNSVYFEVGCLGDDSPARGFPIEDLLLDEPAFPEGWRARRPFDPDDRLPAEQIAVGFYTHRTSGTGLGAGHEVYRFLDGAGCADLAYRFKSRTWFARWEGYGPWRVPAELSYRSRVADRFRLNCCMHQRSSVQNCQAVGRYEEFIVIFGTELDAGDPSYMSFADLERILIAIDEKMALYLGKDIE